MRQRPHADGGASDQPLAEPRGPARSTVGDLLRATRLSFDNEIQQVAETLRIRAEYLSAIESGQYARLPGAVYAQGFVRAYANYLGLDGDEAVRRFKRESGELEKPRDLSVPMPLTPRRIPGGSILLAACVLAVCGYGVWYYLSSGDRARPERVAQVPPEIAPPAAPVVATAAAAPSAAAPPAMPPAAVSSSAPVPPLAAITPVAVPPPRFAEREIAAPPAVPVAPLPAPVVTSPAPTPAQAAPAPPTLAAASPPAAAPLLAPPAPPSGVTPVALVAESAAPPRSYGPDDGTRIVIRATANSWVEVREKGSLLYQRLLHSGDTIRVPDHPGIILATGNAAGLQFTVDGRAAPGVAGQVRHKIYLDPDRLLAGSAAE